MLFQLRNTGFIVIGATLGLIMLGLAALVAVPLLIGTAALAFAQRGKVEQMQRVSRISSAGEVIEGEWTVVDLRARDGRGR